MTDKVVESKQPTKSVADTKAVKQSKEYAEAKKQEMRRRMAAISDCC